MSGSPLSPVAASSPLAAEAQDLRLALVASLALAPRALEEDALEELSPTLEEESGILARELGLGRREEKLPGEREARFGTVRRGRGRSFPEILPSRAS